MLTAQNPSLTKSGRWAAAFLLLGLSIFCGCTPPGPRALLEGKRLIERGKHPQAVEKLRLATSLLVTNAQAWNYLGLACQHAGRAREAEESYHRALVYNHDLTEAHYNLACLWLAENKPEKTEAAKTELLAYTLRRGNSMEGLLKLGLAQLRLRELTGAEKSFNDALRLSAHNPEALNGLGLIRLQRGHANEAAKYFRDALKQQPDYRPALLNLAIVSQVHLNDRPLALQKFREYTALKPSPPDVQTARLLALQLEQDLKPAPAHTNINAVKPFGTSGTRPGNAPKVEPATNPPKPATATSALPPSNVETVKLAAEPVLKPAQDISNTTVENKSQTAEPLVNNAGQQENLTPAEVSRRGLLQRVNPFNRSSNGDPRSVRPTPLPPRAGTPPPQNPATLDQGNPSNSGSAEGVARYLYKSPAKPATGNRSAAQRWFSDGVQAQRSRRLIDAMQAYTRATQLDANYFEAHYNLGLTAAEAKNLPAALTAYENALAVRPESMDGRYNFALALKQAGYILDAVNELEKLLAAYPNEPRANLALGNLYAQQLHQPTKARQLYLRVLERDPHNAQAGAIRYWLTTNP